MNRQSTAAPAADVPALARAVAEFPAHATAVVAVAFTLDRSLLISTDRESTVRVWDLAASRPGERGTIPRTGDPYRSIACAPGSRLVALGSGGASGLVRLYDLTDKTPAEGPILRGGRGAVLALAFSPDGKLIAGGGEDTTLRVWEPGPGSRGDARAALAGHTKPITAIAFAPGGQSLATGSADGTTRIWSVSRLRSSQRAVLPHPAGVDAVAYLPDGKGLVTACRDGFVRVWDVVPITPVVRAEFAGHPGGTRVFIVAADHVTGTGDGSNVTTWDPWSGQAVAVWDVPAGAGTGAALTLDGRYLARGTRAGAVGVFRVAEKRT